MAAALAASPFVPELQAQTERSLVSNTGQPHYLADFKRVSQHFTSGSNGPGYGLTSVGLDLFSSGAIPNDLDISVRIYSTRSTNRQPQDLLYVLSNPSTFTKNAVNRFTAPAGATLTANTSYAVVVSDSAGTGEPDIHITTTPSDNQDSGAAAGWSIGNARFTYDSGSWTRDDSASVIIEIKGTITPNYPATGDPAISGAAQVGMTLTALTSDIMDDNGLTGAVYAYQWIRVTEDGTETEVGTDASSYTLTAADQGHHMKVRVTFTDDGDTDEMRTSGESTLVLLAAVSNCGANTLWCDVLTVGHGFDQAGQIQNVGFGPSQGSLDDATFTYRDVDYTITSLVAIPLPAHTLWLTTEPALPADAGRNLTLHVQKYSSELNLPFSEAQSSLGIWVFTDALFVPPGGSLSDVPLLRSFSNPGAARLAGAPDIGTRVAVRLTRLNAAATGQPSISGFPRVDGLLRAGLGTITDAGGLPGTFPDDYDLQWVRVDADGISNPQDIAGATSGTYTPVAADLGKKLKVKVSFTDARGIAEGPLESEPTPATVRPASAPLLETTLTVGLLRSVNARILGCASTNNVNDCSDPDVLENNRFVSIDEGGVAKEFEIVDLQLTHVGWSERLQRDMGATLAIVFGGIRELRDYEVNNLVLVLDGTRFLFRNADAGGYHVKAWWNADLDWNPGDTVQLRILDAPGALESNVLPPQEPLPPLTASFENLPASHDGSNPFTFRLAFSDDVTIAPSAMRDHGLEVTGGTVTGAARVDGRKDLWEFTVQPADSGEVSIITPLERACTESGALCTADGRQLTSAVPGLVLGPSQEQQEPRQQEPRHQPQAAALTASFEDAPSSHNGSSVFTLRMRFSAALASGGARGRVQRTLSAAGGTVGRVRRVDQRRDLFEIPVQPSGHGPVTVSLPSSASCDIQDALCTPDGRALSAPIKVTVQGPPGLTVADAEVEEAVGAKLVFVLTLSRAFSETVTVRIGTSDGSATAGDDYVAKINKSRTFAPGQTSKVFRVKVLDDNLDEGNEDLTVTLSNASGAYLADATATGTIKNSDPMPQAWLARFGRTVGTHVTDAVGDRLRSTPGQKSHLVLGGYRVPVGRAGKGTARVGRETDLSNEEPGAAEKLVSSERFHEVAEGGAVSAVLIEAVRFLGLRRGYAAGPGGSEWTTREPVPDTSWLDHTGPDPRQVQRPVLRFGDRFDLRRVLLDSHFRVHFNGAEPGDPAPRLTAWGQVSATRFDGRDGALRIDGDVLTGTVGVDGEWNRWLTGVAVAHSRGDGSYAAQDLGAHGMSARGIAADGQDTVEQALTSIHPYMRYAVNERLDVWGVFGYGRGKLTLTPAGGAALQTDANLLMGAFGGRGILLPATDAAGIQLATRTDAMLTRTTSDAVTGTAGNLAATDADAHRLRFILEGSRGFEWTDGRRLTPTVELGLRHDRGDAETGFGVEVGGRVQYAYPARGLTVEGTVRGLLAHEDGDYREWGAAGRLQVSRDPEGRGLSLTLTPAWGAAESGVESLWLRQTTAGLAPQTPRKARTGRLVTEVGYGVTAIGRGLLTSYAGTELADGAVRRYRVGTRLQLTRDQTAGLTLNLEGRRQEPAGPQTEDRGPQAARQDLRLQVRWRF